MTAMTLSDLATTMFKFPPDSDAGRDFVADCVQPRQQGSDNENEKFAREHNTNVCRRANQPGNELQLAAFSDNSCGSWPWETRGITTQLWSSRTC
jgi:hypothetical protein